MKRSTLEKEGPLQVSKWLKIPLLIDEAEMHGLLSCIPESAYFYPIQGIVNEGEEEVTKGKFLEIYAQYVGQLKEGNIPAPIPPYALSEDEQSLYAIEVGEGRVLIKPRLPVIQFQANQVRYSSEDGAFRTQQFGCGGITWGIQISYPQLFQDNKTHEIVGVQTLPNTPLFKTLQKWVRAHTRATPFIVDGRKQNEPIRLGKNLFFLDRKSSQKQACSGKTPRCPKSVGFSLKWTPWISVVQGRSARLHWFPFSRVKRASAPSQTLASKRGVHTAWAQGRTSVCFPNRSSF